MKTLDVVQVFVQVSMERSFCLEVISFPYLCDPLANQNISTALDNFPSLRSLKDADFDHSSSDFEINIFTSQSTYITNMSQKLNKYGPCMTLACS